MGHQPGVVDIRRVEVETSDIAYAHEVVCRRYTDYDMRLRAPADDFLYRSHAAAADGLRVDHLHHRAAIDVVTDTLDFFMTMSPVLGGFAFGRPLDRRVIGVGGTALMPVGVPIPMSFDPIEVHSVCLPLAAVVRTARRTGIAAADFRFTGMEPISPERNRFWLATVAYLHRAFGGPDPVVADRLVLGTVLETAAAAALTVFPNTTMNTGYTAGPGDVAPAAVRRAVDFIDEHAVEPITLDDIAAAAGVAVRDLQAAFARHRGGSPAGYLKRVRLERAHRDLQAADRTRGDTVAAIARRWGFAAPSRFAADYRRTYGRPPGRTLNS